VPSIWDRIAATADNVPLAEWQRAPLEECLGAHHDAPGDARPSTDVIERVQRRLRGGRSRPLLNVRPEAELDAPEAAPSPILPVP
jgi:hypothetical protein